MDCGKSVELYEESAEQLAADQKIYQARSIERERRRKLGKTIVADGGEDLSESEVFALDEPFDGRSRNRNSKKVVDSKSAEKFPNYYRGKDDNRRPNENPTNSFNRGNDDRGFRNHASFSNNYQAYTSEPSTFSTQNYKSRSFTDNRFRENIEEAESGSLVGNLRNSARSGNSLHFDAKLPELKLRTPTSTERPTYSEIRSSTESRKQDFYRSSTVQPDTGRQFYEVTASSTPQLVRNQNLIRTTPKYFVTEKRTTPQQYTFVTTTEGKILRNSLSAVTTPAPTTAPEEDGLSTEKIPVETVYFGSYGKEKGEDLSTTPRLDISLSQLNINKPTAQPDIETKNYEDSVREGLEIPPSSGPNALRSFALYFAGNGLNSLKNDKDAAKDPKDLFYIPTVSEEERKPNTVEEKKKDIVQQVDDIIKDGSRASGDHSQSAAVLPNSLTQQTRDSYSALFDRNKTEKHEMAVTEPDFGTTAFEVFTEDAEKINLELRKNDLDISQSRGPVESDSNANKLNNEFSKVSPDLRELAQVFTKALSAYLDDPEAFRKVLSEIRPTEPSATETSTNPVDYPSVTQEDDEVLDFSDVTKTSYRRRTTTPAYRETTTEYVTESPTTNRDAENFVVSLSPKQNISYVKVPDVELTAPLIESLDESQSRYYTPPPSVIGTTNAIAEEINNEFAVNDKLPDIDSNEAVDSYLPIGGSVDDKSRPRYGGFQNNSNYSPYGSDLITKPYSPYGSELTSTTTTTVATPVSVTEDNDVEVATTFNPRNITSSILFRRKPEGIKKQSSDVSTLAKQLNNLAEQEQERSSIIEPDVPEFESIKLGNGETVERTRTRSTTARPLTSTTLYHPRELSIELSPPFESDPPGGYYEFDSSYSTSKPEEYKTTTFYPTTVTDTAETFLPTTFPTYDSNTSKFTRSTTEDPVEATASTPKSFERIAELQQTLMSTGHNLTHQEMEKARVTVAEAVDNMTDSTANTLMKMMEMAAKNETYRRLVLLLVNDKSGKNKTVEETRLALLRALLMPVISTTRTRRLDAEPAATPSTTRLTTTTTAATRTTTIKDTKRRGGGHFRRSKSISNGETSNIVRITTESPKERAKNGRRTKTRVISRIVKTTEGPTTTFSPSRLSNLELINRTIENSKTKDIKNNSLEDAILDSDSRAVELLRSLYSLAARWG